MMLEKSLYIYIYYKVKMILASVQLVYCRVSEMKMNYYGFVAVGSGDDVVLLMNRASCGQCAG